MNYEYILKRIPELVKVMQALYSNHGGYVKLMFGRDKKGEFFTTEELSNPSKMIDVLEKCGWIDKNIYMSIGTFITSQNARIDNLLDLRAIPVDCDFRKTPGQGQIEMRTALNYVRLMVMEGLIPSPTYVEHSRNLRLIYVLDQPFRFVKESATRDACITLMKRLIQVLCKTVNSWDYKGFCFQAEPQRVTSFVRVPYSLNIRNQGHYDYDEQQYIIDSQDIYDVRVDWLGTVWDFNKLCEFILPETFSGYETWKENKKSKKKKSCKQNIKEVALFRLQDLEKLQSCYGYDIGHREQMCYLYWVHAQKAGYTYAQSQSMTLSFNHGFRHPLTDHQVQTECKPADYRDSTGTKRKGYERKFSDAKIREMLGIKSEPVFLGEDPKKKHQRYYEKKREEMIKQGKTKSQQIEHNAQRVLRLREAGLTWQQVADKIGKSVSTVKRYYRDAK